MMDAAAQFPNQQLNLQKEVSSRLILQPPLNPSGLPSLGFLAHTSLGKLPAWGWEANVMDGLAQMYFGTSPEFGKFRCRFHLLSSS